MRFSIESWAPEYGSGVDLEVGEELAAVQVDHTVEMPVARWDAVDPSARTSMPRTILFTDGIRRVDARIWVDDRDGLSRPGLCASYAAGAVLCDGRATVVSAEIERGLFSLAHDAEPIACKHALYPLRRPESDTPTDLILSVHYRMGELEMTLAGSGNAEVTVVDGPLKGRHGMEGVVGYVKSHHVTYLGPELEPVLGKLDCGQRTPVFLIAGKWSKYSWYMRLPCERANAWAGIVRCETTGDAEPGDVIALADRVTLALPAYASESHKDARAPQNLYPIAGLERELRRRLGDAALLYRSLRVAAAGTRAPAA